MSTSVWENTEEAAKYKDFRPEHPLEIVEKAIEFLKEGFTGPLLQAVDVGCGSGLSTRNLVGRFSSVLGVDLSASMIEEARNSFKGEEGVEFKVSGAEGLPVGDHTAQLVLVGRAIHYFDQNEFFREVDRILCPGGVLAYYSVHFPTVLIKGDEPKSRLVNSIFWGYLDSNLSSYWPVNSFDGVTIGARNRRDYYVNVIKPPFPEVRIDESIHYTRNLSLSTLAGELDTYSAAVTQRKVEGNEIADKMIYEFKTRVKDALDFEDEEEEKTLLQTMNNFYVVMTKKSNK